MYRGLIILLITLLYITNTTAINVLHISDIHYDINYAVGSPSNCYELVSGLDCCRKTDIPKDPWHPADDYGELKCDSPFVLVNSTLKYISDNFHIDLILWTGDSTDHHFFGHTSEDLYNEIYTVTQLILHYFPNTSVVPVLGNHDTKILDQYIPSDLPKIYEMWQQWVPETFVINSGHYVVNYFGRNFVAINSLVIDSNNINNQTNEVEKLYSFLKEYNSPNNWLIGHIAPGSSEAGYNFTDFIKSLSYNTSFWGHSHSDELRLTEGLVIYIAPSVIPDSHYPEFRIYTIENQTVTNYETYLRTGLSGNDTYRFLYDAKNSYSITDFSYQGWLGFSQKIQTNQTLLDNYYYHLNPPFNNGTCDSNCLNEILSDMMV